MCSLSHSGSMQSSALSIFHAVIFRFFDVEMAALNALTYANNNVLNCCVFRLSINIRHLGVSMADGMTLKAMPLFHTHFNFFYPPFLFVGAVDSATLYFLERGCFYFSFQYAFTSLSLPPCIYYSYDFPLATPSRHMVSYCYFFCRSISFIPGLCFPYGNTIMLVL